MNKIHHFSIYVTRKEPFGFCLFLVFLLLYGYHAAPDVTWGDSGELAAVAELPGIAHPTGYPLYTLTGHLLTSLPGFTPARIMNLFSAFCASACLVVLYHLILQVLSLTTGKPKKDRHSFAARFCALFGCLLLGFSPVFISQALITEVYSLSLLFQVSLWLVLILWMQDRLPAGVFFLLLGLALAHHLTLVIFLPFMFLLILQKIRGKPEHQKKLLAQSWLILPGLCLYLYLPLRAMSGPALNWGNPRTLSSFLWVLSGGNFGQFLQFDPLFQQGFRWLLLLFLEHAARLSMQFGGFILLALLALLAPQVIPPGGKEERRASWTVLAVFFSAVILSSAYLSFYRVGDREVFFLVTYPLTVALTAVGLAAGLENLKQRLSPHGRRGGFAGKALQRVFLAAFVIALVLRGWTTIPETSARGDTAALDYGTAVVGSLPPDALLITGLRRTDSDNALLPLWYQKWGLGIAPNMVFVGVNFFNSPWYRFQLPEDVWFPDQKDLLQPRHMIEGYTEWFPTHDNLVLKPLAIEIEPGRTLFPSRRDWIQAIVVFLKKNETGRPLYSISMIPEIEKYYRAEPVEHIPISAGTVPADYQKFLPKGKIYRLRPLQKPKSEVTDG